MDKRQIGAEQEEDGVNKRKREGGQGVYRRRIGAELESDRRWTAARH